MDFFEAPRQIQELGQVFRLGAGFLRLLQGLVELRPDSFLGEGLGSLLEDRVDHDHVNQIDLIDAKQSQGASPREERQEQHQQGPLFHGSGVSFTPILRAK